MQMTSTFIFTSEKIMHMISQKTNSKLDNILKSFETVYTESF